MLILICYFESVHVFVIKFILIIVIGLFDSKNMQVLKCSSKMYSSNYGWNICSLIVITKEISIEENRNNYDMKII